jgi:hypothetical protein
MLWACSFTSLGQCQNIRESCTDAGRVDVLGDQDLEKPCGIRANDRVVGFGGVEGGSDEFFECDGVEVMRVRK